MQKDNDGRYYVHIRLNDAAAKKFHEFTTAHVGERVTVTLDGETITTAVVQDEISSGLIASNRMAEEEAAKLLQRMGKDPCDLKVTRNNLKNQVSNYPLEPLWIDSVTLLRQEDGDALVIEFVGFFLRALQARQPGDPDYTFRFMHGDTELAVMRHSEVLSAGGLVTTRTFPEAQARRVARELTSLEWQVE